MDTVRIGVVGIGNMGSAHAKNIHSGKVEHLHLAAICDIDPKKQEWARENLPGVVIFSDYNEMFKSGLIDAAIVATPHYLHPPIATAALDAGLHVLSEKPAGVFTNQLTEYYEKAKASGKVFGIMFNQRTNPLFQKAREIVQSGELGVRKRLVWIITNWYRNQVYYDSGTWRATWNGEGGGVLLNQAPHNLDLWQWIFGMPKTVRGFCTCGKYHNIEVEDDATIYAEYEDGATATFITTTGDYPGTNRLEITGDRGKIVLENGKLTFWKLPVPEREFCFDPEGKKPTPEVIEYVPETKETAHIGILQNFTNNILFGEPLLAPGYDGINELTISNAAYLSSWTDSKVTLPIDADKFEELLKEKVKKSIEEQGQKEFTGDISATAGTLIDRWSVNW